MLVLQPGAVCTLAADCMARIVGHGNVRRHRCSRAVLFGAVVWPVSPGAVVFEAWQAARLDLVSGVFEAIDAGHAGDHSVVLAVEVPRWRDDAKVVTAAMRADIAGRTDFCTVDLAGVLS